MGETNQTKTLKNSFSEKVEAERKILKLINKFNDPRNELGSLSLGAINEWLRRLESKNHAEIESCVHQLIRIRNVLSTRHYHQRPQNDMANAYAKLEIELERLELLLAVS